MKKTAIIILNYNNSFDTINCIKSVEKYNTASIKLVVVDNGSPDLNAVVEIDAFLSELFCDDYKRFDEGDEVRYPLPYASFLVCSENAGYARGNNKGLCLVENDDEIDRVLILNNDILFIEDIIPDLIKTQDSTPDCAIISPLLLKRDGMTPDYTCARIDPSLSFMTMNNFITPFYWLFNVPYETSFGKFMILKSMASPYPPLVRIELPSGSCMLVKKDIFSNIGYFDPNTFLYYEENILYRKIKGVKMYNYINTRLRCIHLGASSTSKRPSAYIAKASFDSQAYYVRTYIRPSKFKASLFSLSQLWLRSMENLKNRVK